MVYFLALLLATIGGFLIGVCVAAAYFLSFAKNMPNEEETFGGNEDDGN